MSESALTPDHRTYNARLRAVIVRGAPACRAYGPHHARCILEPGHAGNEHEGNGFDEWGPKYERWTAHQ